ncbi:MAG: carboxypeptidase regulatory-like domain-containing protein [Gemmatimonadota bacterium]
MASTAPRRSLYRSLCTALLALLAPASAGAQSVLVRVMAAESASPIQGAMAWLLDAEGKPLDRALTDEQGRYLFTRLDPGRYRVRAEMIGRATAESETFTVAASGAPLVRTLALATQVIELEGIGVEGESRCRLRPEEGLAVARVWEEVRKALDAAAYTETHVAYRYRTVTSERELGEDARTVLTERRRVATGFMARPYESVPADTLLEKGFVQIDAGGGGSYYAPDAEVLLSDAFLDTHCFALRPGDMDHLGSVGLAFEPVPGRRISDISGVLWLQASTMALQSLVFRYEHLRYPVESDLIGGRIDFRRLPDGTWIIPEWFIRMPKIAVPTGGMGNRDPRVVGYVQTTGVVRSVRDASGKLILDAETATIDGVAVDSTGSEPLSGARVRLLGTPDSALTDADGRFRFTGLQGGTYQVSFSHPSLDSLGFEAEPVPADVSPGRIVSVRLQAPSLGPLISAACGEEGRPAQTAVLFGRVLGPVGEGVPGATLRIDWETYGHVAEVITQQRGGVELTTGPGGAYHACGVPTDEKLSVTISHPEHPSRTDSLRVPAGRVTATRDFVLGKAPGGTSRDGLP